MVTLAEIQSAFAGHEPPRLPAPREVRGRASVAMMFAGPEEALSLCLIRRTERADDRWSGQMAFPGGRADEGDANAMATAERETLEEVGVALQTQHYLGGLSDIPLRPVIDGDNVLSPFAYYFGSTLPPLRPEPKEIAAAFWIPLSHLWSAEHLTTIDWEHRGHVRTFPGIRWGGDVIWGLTHRVLCSFAELLDAPLPAMTPPPPG
ncbi:MAG: CoA pyrophosphatase [Myxococcota bacterium]